MAIIKTPLQRDPSIMVSTLMYYKPHTSMGSPSATRDLRVLNQSASAGGFGILLLGRKIATV